MAWRVWCLTTVFGCVPCTGDPAGAEWQAAGVSASLSGHPVQADAWVLAASAFRPLHHEGDPCQAQCPVLPPVRGHPAPTLSPALPGTHI